MPLNSQNFYIDIRGIGQGMKGFSSSILEIETCGGLQETQERQSLRRKRGKAHIADICYIGNREVIVLIDDGRLTLWRFERLDIAKCIDHAQVEIKKREICYK